MNLQEFLKSEAAKGLADKAKTLKNVEEAMNFAKAQGIEATEEEVKQFLSTIASKQQLSENDLDKVLGGTDINSANPRCPECGGHLSCVDPSGEWHGCGIWTYNLYACDNCGEEYKHYWDGDEWS